VAALSVFASFVRSRIGVSRQARSLEPVEKLMLTPQHALHLVRVAGRDVLVATHPQGCTFIQAMPIERGASA
jgi:flagellar biogenesis protein FliO